MKKALISLMMALTIVSLPKLQAQEWSQYVDIEQYKVIDTAKYEITYDIVAKIKANQKRKCKLGRKCRGCNIHDRQTLLIGRHCSATYSQMLLDLAEANKKLIEQGAKAVPCPQLSFAEDIFKHYPKQDKITALYRLFTDAGSLQYEEPMPHFDWQLHQEYKTLLDYKCQKATCTFRGRNYTAWFTEEIPISEGPWKFGGLAGLILQVEDSEGHYFFNCVGLKELKEVNPIRLWTNNKIKKTSRKKMLKIIARMYKQPVAFGESMGKVYHIKGRRDFSYPYNPIERE